jgi:hypothetical protein
VNARTHGGHGRYMLTEMRLLLAVPLAMIAISLLVANGVVLVRGVLLKLRSPSWIPLIGGAAGCLALLIADWHAGKRWCWIPLVVDWGSLPGITHAVIHRVRGAR